MNEVVKSVLQRQSVYFDFPIEIYDIHPFRAGGGDIWTATVVPKGVGRNATALAQRIFENKLRCFVDRISYSEACEIAELKGMNEVPIMPREVSCGIRQC